MTFVVGVRRLGTAAIITDSLLTDPRTGDQRFEFLKNGILFPGCIYGVAGSWHRALDFIDTVQAKALGLSPADAWRVIEQVVEGYASGADGFSWKDTTLDQFDILLSSRHSGAPELYHLDSSRRQLIRPGSNWYAVGLGVNVLYDVVRQFFSVKLSEESIKAWANFPGRTAASDFPYLLTFFLEQFSFSEFGSAALNKANTGGFFHFLTQDSTSEARQKPSLHLFAAKTDQVGKYAQFRRRIAFDVHPVLGDTLVFYDKFFGQKGT
jgi:hypothetical protein